MDPYDYLFKIVIIGDATVGKSSIIKRFIDNTFTKSCESTIGVDCKIKIIDNNNKKIKIKIYDTAGQERFYSITSSYYKGVDAIIIAFDLTNRKSFENVKKWYHDSSLINSCPKFLIGTKSDLSFMRKINLSDIENISDEMNINYIETSAKTGDSIEDIFISICNKLVINYDEHNNTKLQFNIEKYENSRCCWW